MVAARLTAATGLLAIAFSSFACAAMPESGEAASTAKISPSPVSEEDWNRITGGMDAFLKRIEALDVYPPGAAIIIATGDGRSYIRTHGTLKAGSGVPVDKDGAFYIASMTKAYLGLLAARLDADGTLPLSSSLADYWPDLVLPEGGRQAGEITLHDLLTHSFPFEVEPITFLEAYVRDVAPSEYPGLIAAHAEPREDGFQYDNLGYNIYAAILEQETGRNWRAWLQEEIFNPLGFTATSGLTSSYAPDALAWSHQMAGTFEDTWPRAGDWYLLPPKTDGMMQSAGGLMTSAADMSKWLQYNIAEAGPAGSDLDAEIFARAHEQGAETEADGHGFSCDGYSLGWNICELIIEPQEEGAPPVLLGPLLQHGGGYTGVRSLMTVSPGLDIGIAVLTNSDSMTGFMSTELSKLPYELLAEAPGAGDRADSRVDAYSRNNARYLTHLQDQLAQARSDEKWQGWDWQPSIGDLSEFSGSFRNDGAILPGALITLGESGLVLKTGERLYRLEPAAPDLFGAQAYAYDEIHAVSFVRDENGAITAMNWDGDDYERVD